MAAAARRSGTRSPLESTLKRGSAVSATSRAIAAARALARVALRERDRAAEYAVDRVVFLAADAFGAVRGEAFADALGRVRVPAAAASDVVAPKLPRPASAQAQSGSSLFTRKPQMDCESESVGRGSF